MTSPTDEDALGWWTMSGSEFMRALRAVADGGDPDAVYAEWYANSDHEYPSSDGR